MCRGRHRGVWRLQVSGTLFQTKRKIGPRKVLGLSSLGVSLLWRSEDTFLTSMRFLRPAILIRSLFIPLNLAPSSPLQILEPEVLKSMGVSNPHTTHCLPNGKVMISTMGDEHGRGKGSFATFDSVSFEPLGQCPGISSCTALGR